MLQFGQEVASFAVVSQLDNSKPNSLAFLAPLTFHESTTLLFLDVYFVHCKLHSLCIYINCHLLKCDVYYFMRTFVKALILLICVHKRAFLLHINVCSLGFTLHKYIVGFILTSGQC